MRTERLLLFLVPAFLWSQEPLTLDQVIAEALQHNRHIQATQAEIRKSENAIEVMRTYRLPQFKFDTLDGVFLTRVNFQFPAGIFGVFPEIGPVPPVTTDVTTPRRPFALLFAQANQPLSQLFRIGLGVQAEKLNQQVAETRLTLEQQTVVNDVKKTYYSLVQAQSALRATEETIKLFQELNRVATNALAEQVVLRSDVLDAQAGLAKTELQATTLRDTSATLKERLNDLLGRDLSTDFTVSELGDPRPWDLDLASTRARALDQRPEVQEARLKVQQAELDRRAKRAEYIPDVSLSLNYVSAFNVEVLPKNVVGLGFLVNWDVFDWGRRKHELASKTETIDQAKIGLQETMAQIEVEVGLNFRKLEETRQQLRLADLELQADQEKVRVALNRYNQNSVMLKDVLQLRASLAEKTFRYQDTLVNFWTARADLEKVVAEH